MFGCVGRAWTPKRQGDLGEVSAMEWLVRAGARVFVPVGSSPDYDLVADFGGRLVRVQVKTSTCWRNDRYEVTLATRGGNQSWSGLVKVLDPSRCDSLFVHVADGRRWYIPSSSSSIGGGSLILLGGPKYAQFEVQSGIPLPSREAAEIAPQR
jgi:hypothetical protein